MRKSQLPITNYQLLLGLSLLIALFLSACAQPTGEPKPPDIVYNRDMCEACGMIISDARFAAATLTTDGRSLKFDDAGEMFGYHARNSQVQVRAWFVHDYDSQKWINGKDAFYVIARDIKSPMGTGVATFAERANAETLAKRFNVNVLTFDQAFTAIKEGKSGM
ncbi:MAG: nitrous oxide reductase accessory protein NosL [Chloroflexi bacterium]|nr:nitrous oxide reductase accessory protein NosL [Chloroflexota bacterium]